MISAEQIATSDIFNLLSKFENLGGVIDFKIFKLVGEGTDREAHCLVAQRTLELLSTNECEFFGQVASPLDSVGDASLKIQYKQLFNFEGERISPEEFFGPYFNFKEKRPILLGKTGKRVAEAIVFRDYFHYDDTEKSENIVLIQHINDHFITQGYTDAFLRPPYNFGKKDMTNYEIGKFFLEFNRFLFDNFEDLTIYSWPTGCSNYFDDGKEWWGSYFWTVYNPTKNWHIGIAASTTD